MSETARKPPAGAHTIWEIVVHLTAELDYARTVIDGSPEPWIESTMPVRSHC